MLEEIIKAQGASISAVVSQGRLNWEIYIDCGSIVLDGCEWEISTGVEWINWPVRSWDELDGLSIKECADMSEVESSFYLAQHHELKISQLQIMKQADKFIVNLSGSFDLNGFDKFDGVVEIDLSCDLKIEGIIVVPENMFPKPTTIKEIEALVEPLFDQSLLAEPQHEGFRYLLKPI